MSFLAFLAILGNTAVSHSSLSFKDRKIFSNPGFSWLFLLLRQILGFPWKPRVNSWLSRLFLEWHPRLSKKARKSFLFLALRAPGFFLRGQEWLYQKNRYLTTPSLIQSYFIFNKFFEWKKEQQQTIGHAKILFQIWTLHCCLHMQVTLTYYFKVFWEITL